MLISLEKKILGDAVAVVSRFAARSVMTLPALSAIAIRAEGDEIRLRATNLETSIELIVPGTVRTPGTIALPASILKDVAGSFSGGGVVSIEKKAELAVLSSEKGKSTMKTLPYDDVPTLGMPEKPKSTFTLSGAILRSLIGMVASYASTSTVRPELASVLLSAEGGTVKAVATDSFRLAEKKVSVGGTLAPFTMLIPAKNALDLIQTIPDEDIQVAVDEHQCVFSWKSGMAMSRLVAMSYPDYQQIIPKSFSAEATLLKKDFEAALRRTAVFSDSFQKIRLGIDPKGKVVSLSAQNTDIGESSEELQGSTTGESIELSFNHRYLSAPLPSMTAESISLSASGIGRPLVMRAMGDQSFLYLVMPMNQ